jgi:glycosyltransferase involved in cell wall biosynthesis
MNILYICDEYPPGPNGGIGSVVQNLARELVKQGHKVYVVGLYPIGYGFEDYEEDNGVKVWRLRYEQYFSNNKILKVLLRSLPSVARSMLKTHKAYESFVMFIKTLIAKESIDIVEMPDWNTFIYEIGINKVFPKLDVPLVVKFHCSRSYLSRELGFPLKKKWFKIDKAIYDRGDALAAVSCYTAVQTNSLFMAKKDIRVLYNGVSIDHDHKQEERLSSLVFYSGSLVKNKGVFSLMKAWNLVIDKFPTAKLIMFGKGENKALLEHLSIKAKDSVRFEGHQPKQTLLETLGFATLAVFPSYSETFGLGAVESMSCACPTIFTKRSCGSEIIQHNVNGLLIDPDDIEEIANNILLLLNDELKRKELGQRGMAEATKKFNLSFIAQQHITWYSEVIANFANGFKLGNS